MTRLSPLLLLLALLSQCGVTRVSTSRAHAVPQPVRIGVPAREFSLRNGESRTFRPGSLRPGDLVICKLGGRPLHIRIPNRPNGGWSVGTGLATPTGGTGQLQVTAASDGSVTASCGRKTS